MKNIILFGSLVVFSFSANTMALDKKKIEDHIRKTLNESNETEFILSEPEESEFRDLWKVPMIIRNKRGEQSQTIYVSKDQKKYILGNILDLSVDPDEERLKQLQLKDVYYKGWNKAPVTVVEFSDMQCGYCRKAHMGIEKDLYKTFSKKQVRLVFKQFPLSRHKWAGDASVAAVCAGQQSNSAFWGMTNMIFDDAKATTPENIEEKVLKYAGDLKLNKRRFQECLVDPKSIERVNKERQEGIAVGVRSTPTFFVNGRMVRGFRDFKTSLKPYIDEKLK